MNVKTNFNKIVSGELGLIFLLWLISVVVSNPIFYQPLGSHRGWLTAHTLVSMRAFEEWGFWKLLGASVLIPKSYEFLGVDLTTFTKAEGIYLSYPSLWLVLPYITFKFLNLLQLNVSLSIEYIQTYNLVLNRLICGGVVYYLCLEIVKIISGNSLTDYKKRLIAFLGLVGWMFTPPVMYWTQNVYFTDQAVLLPIYIIFLNSLKCKLKFKELSGFAKALLFIASFSACGIDWYGWVSVAVILFLVFIDALLSRDTRFKFKDFLKQYLNSIKFIFLGMVTSGLTFFAQLLYYKDGIKQILETFFYRSGVMVLVDYNNLPLKSIFLFRHIVSHWIPYFPQILQQPLRQVVERPLKNIDSQLLISLIVFVLLSLIFLSLLYFFYKKVEDKKLAVYAFVLVFLVPLIQIYLLKQHSFVHIFSAFKMGFPITLSLLLLPATISISFFANKFRQSFTKPSFDGLLTLFALALGLIIIISSKSGIINFASVPNNLNQELGSIVSRNFASDDLLIADPKQSSLVQELPESLVVGPIPPLPPFPPTQLWYTKRFIYYSNQLKDLHLRVNAQNLKSMKPVFLAYKDLSSKASVSSICQGQWLDLAGKIEGREVVACRSPKLRHLLGIGEW